MSIFCRVFFSIGPDLSLYANQPIGNKGHAAFTGDAGHVKDSKKLLFGSDMF